VSKIVRDFKVPSQNDGALTDGELDAVAAGATGVAGGGRNGLQAEDTAGANFVLCDGSVRFIKGSVDLR
jgi:prepilin-type processing-associated H-X9-DG protein